MSQTEYLDIADLEKLISVAKANNQPIEVDWVNRSICVLSQYNGILNPKISTGTLIWRDCLLSVEAYEIDGRDSYIDLYSAEIEEFVDENDEHLPKFCLGHHYCHGDAEGFMGHDIIVMPNEFHFLEGVHRVRTHNADNQHMYADLYVWYEPEGPRYEHYEIWQTEGHKARGLCVLTNDDAAVAYAKECMVKKPNHL